MMENTLEFSLDSSVDIDQYDWSTQITNYSDLTFNNSTAKKFSKKNVTNFSFKSPKADKNKILKPNKKETTKKQIIPEVVGKKKCKQKLNIIKFHEDSIKNRLRARNTSTINRLSNSNSSIDLSVIEHANLEKRKCQNNQSGDSIQDFFSHEISKGGAALPNKTAQISKKKKRKMILKKSKVTKNTESILENCSIDKSIINNYYIDLHKINADKSIINENMPSKLHPINSSSIDIQHLSNRSPVDNSSVIPETGEFIEKSISNEFIENLNQSNINDSVLINKSQTSIRYLESDKTFVLSNAEDGQNIADKSIINEYREMPSKLSPINSSSIDIQHLSNRSPVDNSSVIPETGEVIEKSISNEFIENRNQSNIIDSGLINKSQSSKRSFQSNKTFVLRNSDEGQNVADKSIPNENPEITYKLSRENSTFREMQSIRLNENPSKINDIINNSHPLINLDSERSILSEIPEIISILSPINSSGIEIETLSEQSPVKNSLLLPEKSISNEFIEYRNQSNIIDSVLINKSQTSIRYSESDKTFVLSNAEDGQNISDKSIINENSKMSSKLSHKNLSNKSQVDNSSVFPEKSISNEFIENLNQSDIIDSVLINNSQTSIRYLESDKTFVLSNAEDKNIADQSIINEISEIPSNLSSIDSSSVEIQALSEFIENRNQSNIDGSVIINEFQLPMECSGSNTNEPGLANHNIANKSIINENQSNLSSIDSSGIEILALTEQSQVDNSSVIPEKPISNRFIENQNQSNIDRSILINKLRLPIECLGSNNDESGLENHNIANKSIINEYPEMNLNENDNSHLLINTDSERFSKIPEMSSKSFPMINSSSRYIDSSRQLLMSNSSKKFNREDFSIEFNENLNQSNVSNSPIVNVLQRPMECLESCKLSNPNASGLKHQNNSNKSILNNKGGESPRHNVMIGANESIGCEQRFSDTNSFREIELPQNCVLTNNSLNMSQTNENVRMECLEKSENELYHSIVDENNSIEPEIPSTLNNENNLLMPLSISKSPNNVIIIGNSALKNSTFSSKISPQEQTVEKSFSNRFYRKETGTCSKVYDDIEMSNVLDNQKSVINNNSLLPNRKKSILKENQMVQDNLMTSSLNSELQISPNQSISLVNKSVINNSLLKRKKSILKENQMVQDNLMTSSLNSESQISPNQSISLVNKSVINNSLPNRKKSILKENQTVQDNLMTSSLNSESQISPNQSIEPNHTQIIDNEVGESVNAEKNVTPTGKTDKVDICLEREVNSNVDKIEISAKHIENIPASEIEFRNSLCEEIKDGKETARNPIQTDNNISNGIINEPNKDLLDVETVNENSKPMENIMDKIHSSTDMSFLKHLAVQSLSRIISLETGETDIQHSPYIDLVEEKLHDILSTIVTSRQNDIESRKGKNNGTQTDKIVRKRSVKIQCELSDYEETADMDLKTIWIRKAMDFKGDEMKSSIKDVEGEIIPRETKVPLVCDNDVESSQAISRINLPPSHSKIAKSQQPGNDIEIPNIIDSDKHLSIRNTNELESNFKVSYFESTRVMGGNNQKLQVNLSSIDNVATSSAQTTDNPTNGNFSSEYKSIVDSENENIDSFSGGGKLPSAVKHLPHDKNQYSVIPEEVDEISGMKQSDNVDENVSIPTDKQSINPVVKRTRNYKIDLNDISSIKRDPGNPFNFIDFSLSVIKPVLRNTARSFQSVNDPIILDPGVIDRGHGKRKVIKPISHPKEVIIRRKDGNVIRMMPPSPDTVSRRRKAKNHQDNEHKFQNYLRPLDGISILTNESIRTKVVFFSKEICFEGAIKSKPTKIQFRTLTRTKTNTKTDAMFRCPFKNVYIIINQYKFLFEPDKIFLVPKAVPFMFYNRSELAVTITETCPSLPQ